MYVYIYIYIYVHQGQPVALVVGVADLFTLLVLLSVWFVEYYDYLCVYVFCTVVVD